MLQTTTFVTTSCTMLKKSYFISTIIQFKSIYATKCYEQSNQPTPFLPTKNTKAINKKTKQEGNFLEKQNKEKRYNSVLRMHPLVFILMIYSFFLDATSSILTLNLRIESIAYEIRNQDQFVLDTICFSISESL